jgi:hypothetical protein
VRAFEQPVNLEDGDDVFYRPVFTVGRTRHWQLRDEHAARLRAYLPDRVKQVLR